MSIFQRLFKIGQAEGHNVINKLEDPIRMTEQGLRDLKSDLQSAMTGLAEVKGVAIRLTKEAEQDKRQASEYERKAMLMLQCAQAGHMDMAQAEDLATEALTMKDSASERAIRLFKDAEQQQRLASQLQEKIGQFKSTISTHENELITLRGRAKTAAATQKINQQLSQIDSSGTIALLERMKNKVEEDEALGRHTAKWPTSMHLLMRKST
ncbi:MAG: PspA/IM30 family protein, partial [Candidatus Tectomicrobia bacterium]|nr:PspA/IM30 family protein [Candidatus Tectomicrobia bacterium]